MRLDVVIVRIAGNQSAALRACTVHLTARYFIAVGQPADCSCSTGASNPFRTDDDKIEIKTVDAVRWTRAGPQLSEQLLLAQSFKERLHTVICASCDLYNETRPNASPVLS